MVGGMTYRNGMLTWTGGGGGGGVSSVGLSMPTGFSVTGSPITGSGTLAVTTTLNGYLKGTGSAFSAVSSIPASDVTGLASVATTGAYSSLTGTPSLATVATSGSAADLSTGTLAAARMPALTGDVTTTAGSVATTLANSGVTAGTYTNASVTVDAKGRVTSASSGSSLQFMSYPSGFPSSNDTGAFATLSNAFILAKPFTVDSLFGAFNSSSIGDVYNMFIATVSSSGVISATVATGSAVTTTATGYQQAEFTLSSSVTLSAGTNYIVALVLKNRTTTTACRAGLTTNPYAGIALDFGAMNTVYGGTIKRFWYTQNSDAPTSGTPASSATTNAQYVLGILGHF